MTRSQPGDLLQRSAMERAETKTAKMNLAGAGELGQFRRRPRVGEIGVHSLPNRSETGEPAVGLDQTLNLRVDDGAPGLQAFGIIRAQGFAMESAQGPFPEQRIGASHAGFRSEEAREFAAVVGKNDPRHLPASVVGHLRPMRNLPRE